MVIEKENTVGIDSLVSYIQNGLNKKLIWADQIDLYPRCYIVYRDDAVTVEHYYNNGEYDRINNAEGNKCFFVLVGNPEKENNTYYSAQLDLYFTLHLNEIKPLVSHRADEEVRTDVLRVIEAFNIGSSVVNIDTVILGVENVYRGFNFNPDDDMHPRHCFKVRLNVKYDIDLKYCCC